MKTDNHKPASELHESALYTPSSSPPSAHFSSSSSRSSGELEMRSTDEPMEHDSSSSSSPYEPTSSESSSSSSGDKPDCPPCDQSDAFVSFAEASGPKFRKVALNGTPLSDEKPQAKDETDQESEETYIDALTLSVRHDTSDVYIPIPGGELSLAVKRSVTEEQWSTYPGIAPADRMDRPFGVCWTSGLTPSVQLTWKTISEPPPGDCQCEKERPDPDYVLVTDENGSTHRFVAIWKKGGGAPPQRHFLPVPSNRTEQDSFLMRLEFTGSGFVFSRKFGTKLFFQDAGLIQPVLLNPGKPDPQWHYYQYYRATHATDRLGNQLTYNYGGSGTLIPDSISGGSRTIEIAHNGRLITQVTDARGITTTYTYSSASLLGFTVDRLTSVSRTEGVTTLYGYNWHIELDTTPRSPDSTEPAHYFLHYNVSSITDGLNRTYAFNYSLDLSKQCFSTAPGFGIWYTQPGLPRIVTKVDLPDGLSSEFTQVVESPLRILTQLDEFGLEEDVSSLTGERATVVKDAMGLDRTYSWGAAKLVDTKEFEDLFFDTGSPRKRFFLILWGSMNLTHPTGVTEAFTFDLGAGMATMSVTDYSGNTTSYTYGDSWSVLTVLPWLPPALASHPLFSTRYADPTSQTNADGKTKYFSYKSTDPLLPGARVMTQIIDEEGRTTVYNVDGTTGLRLSETVVGGKTTNYTYGDAGYNGFLKSVTVVGGTGSGPLVTTYTADSYGYKATESVGGTTRRFEHDAHGNQTLATDGNGNATTFDYDGVGRLIEVHPPGPGSKTFNYDPAGNKTREEDENGVSTTFTYDDFNRLLSSNREGIITRHTYNALGSRLSTKDPNGGTTHFAYDDIQRLTRTTDPQNGVTTYSYGDNSGSSVFDVSGFKPTQVKDPGNYTTVTEYDNLYRPVSVSRDYGSGTAVTVTLYDDVGNPTRVTDPLGKQTHTTYDVLNRPTQVEYDDGTEVSTVYSSAGLVLSTTDEMNRTTAHEYDSAGRRVKTTLPGGAEIEMVYDDAGNVISSTDPNGNETTFVYDNRNRKTREELSAIGRVILTEYDPVGNVTSVTDANGNETVTDYDFANRPILVATDDGAEVTTTYDDNGNILTVQDPLGNVTTNVYDELNRLTSTTTSPSSGTSIRVEYEYDALGNRTLQEDGEGHRVSFSYDGLGRLLSTTHDAGTVKAATESHSYNAVNKVSTTDPSGRTVAFSYDDRHRLTGEHVTSGRSQDSRTRSYDDVGNLISVTHAGETWRNVYQTYNNRNQVVTETSSGITHSHTYDDNGNPTVTTYGKSGRVLTRVYDAGNRLLSQQDVMSGQPTRLTSFAYDPQGNVTLKTLVDGSTEHRIYDVRNRVARMEVKEPGGASTRLLQEYEYDYAGNMTLLTESSPGGSLPDRELICTYDGVHRLKVESDLRGDGPAVVTTYTYDRANNRVSRNISRGPGAGTTTYRLGTGSNGAGASQILDYRRPDGTVVQFSYNANGARTMCTDGEKVETYNYDVWNRLLSWKRASADTAQESRAEYSYDARTRRVSREEWMVYGAGSSQVTLCGPGESPLPGQQDLCAPCTGGPTASYQQRVLSFMGGVSVLEYVAAPGTAAGSLPAAEVEYTRGPDMGGGVGGMLYSIRAGIASLSHSNARGDVVAKVGEADSAISWEAQYDAYGKRPEEKGANEDRQRANSKEEDPTGLLNEGFRYRDLETGTFITRDPAGFVDGPNLYTYVRQNPWTKWDPDGLEEAGMWDRFKTWIGNAVIGLSTHSPSEVASVATDSAVDRAINPAAGYRDAISGESLNIRPLNTDPNSDANAAAEMLQVVAGSVFGVLGGRGGRSNVGGRTAKQTHNQGEIELHEQFGNNNQKPRFTRSEWQAPDGRGTGQKYTVYQQDIDWTLEVEGLTNKQRATNGNAPYIMKNGKPEKIELHHSRQNSRGPLYEVSAPTHRARRRSGGQALHPYGRKKHPDHPVDRSAFGVDREQYWIDRANKIKKQ